MSKIKRPTAIIPMPEQYVQAALRQVGRSYFSTPYPGHWVLYQLWSLLPDQILRPFLPGTMEHIRRLALQRMQAKGK